MNRVEVTFAQRCDGIIRLDATEDGTLHENPIDIDETETFFVTVDHEEWPLYDLDDVTEAAAKMIIGGWDMEIAIKILHQIWPIDDNITDEDWKKEIREREQEIRERKTDEEPS